MGLGGSGVSTVGLHPFSTLISAVTCPGKGKAVCDLPQMLHIVGSLKEKIIGGLNSGNGSPVASHSCVSERRPVLAPPEYAIVSLRNKIQKILTASHCIQLKAGYLVLPKGPHLPPLWAMHPEPCKLWCPLKVLLPPLVQHALGHELEGERSKQSSTFFGAYTPCSIITSSWKLRTEKNCEGKMGHFYQWRCSVGRWLNRLERDLINVDL